ncbi:MAG: WbqC family protein [Bacteroidota bacterium]
MDNLILPSYYFGPVSWYVACLQGNPPLIHQGLTYRKQQFFSRMHIRHAQGVLPLSLPIHRRGERKPLKEKQISYQENWPRHHWRSIRFAYQNAPYFLYYEEELMEIYTRRPRYLVEWHEACLEWTCEALGIDMPDSTIEEPGLPAAQKWHQQFDPTLNQQPVWMKPASYTQVFPGFYPGLSILDLICNLGPESAAWLRQALDAERWEKNNRPGL